MTPRVKEKEAHYKQQTLTLTKKEKRTIGIVFVQRKCLPNRIGNHLQMLRYSQVQIEEGRTNKG